MNSILKSNIISLGIFFGVSFVLISATNHFILTINFFDNSGEYLTGIPGQEKEVYESLQKYIYLSTVAYSLIKLSVISLIFYTAFFLADVKLSYSRVFNVVLWAEFIFFIPAVIKIVWFRHYYPNGTIAEWHKVYILSLLSLFNDVPADWYYPLQTLNVFETAYWFILAYGFYKVTHLTYDQALRLVVSSYLPALFIWISVIAFCTLMLSPVNA